MTTLKNIRKKDIWNIFDSEMKKNLDEDIECVYSDKFIDNKCSSCDDPLFISEDGFYCCSNKSCGVIYKDVLDFGAEWRYYGADDVKFC